MEITTDTIIKQNLYISCDEKLSIKDCTIKIASDTHIICLGKFEASNVHFEPLKDTFGAIAIMSYNKESKISHCTFKNGTGISIGCFQDIPIFWEIFSLEDWGYNHEDVCKIALTTKIAGALFCVDTKIDQCIFEDCQSEDDGGSLYAISSIIRDSKFINSYSKGDYGAICGKKSTIIRCCFFNCKADDSGGAIGREDVQISDCLFIMCHAQKRGGAIFGLENGSIFSSKFINCSAESGGAIDGAGNLSYCVFKSCSATTMGGAITLNVKLAHISDCKFFNCNVVSNDKSSDVVSFCSNKTVIQNCIFKNTKESCKVFIDGCSYIVLDSRFTSKFKLSSPIDGCCEIKLVACYYNGSQLSELLPLSNN